MNPSSDARYSPVRILGKLDSEPNRGGVVLFMDGHDLSELIHPYFKDGQDIEITIRQRHTEGWGE
jgi:hypothetical protein